MSIDALWSKFMDIRTRPLWKRFPGQYRAQIVETNDPLNMGRVRFRCPDMHDANIPEGLCPWALPSNDMGGKAKRFVSPCVGDWVWVSFERQHPYGPVWTGFADPMRRRLYVLPQVTTPTPASVDVIGRNIGNPTDYNVAYLPRDGRPMAHGWQDRYGNLEMHSAVGFFPTEHRKPPAQADYDAVTNGFFDIQREGPAINEPDRKYMLRATKYGHFMIMSDVGYYWIKNQNFGEFEGSIENDQLYEANRWNYLQKMANEDAPAGKDQRKIMMATRYGHLIEMRDVGWAQPGPLPSQTRAGEYGDRTFLSLERERDQRWVKIRTKGGMLFQASDVGNNPGFDTFVNRPTLNDVTQSPEREEEYWTNKDARFMRLCTRHGFKIVLDDRGTNTVTADTAEQPRGNGVLIKGRRTGKSKAQIAEGSPTGFYWEFNENDLANHTSWGTPLGTTVEMNDRFQYLMLAANLGKDWPQRHQGLKENEFIRKHTASVAEFNSHHLKIDADNEYIRFKTRAGRGNAPDDQFMPVSGGEQQGFEARDGDGGDGPWVELVDSERRGLWFSKRIGAGIWRAKADANMFQILDDRQNTMMLLNLKAGGKIEIYSVGDVNISSAKTLRLQSTDKIEMVANNGIYMNGQGVKMAIANGSISTQTLFRAAKFEGVATASVIAGKTGSFTGPTVTVKDIQPVAYPTLPPQLEPTDRGKTYNGPFEPCPVEEVEHPRVP